MTLSREAAHRAVVDFYVRAHAGTGHFVFEGSGLGRYWISRERTLAFLADAVEASAGMHVLEAGCGGGGSAVWLARRRRAAVVGITIVEPHLRVCRRRARRHGVADRAQFLLADYHACPFEDASFDVAWLLESLCHAERKEEVLAEMYRVLRPPGRLMVADFVRSARHERGAPEELAAWLRPLAIPNLATLEELGALARTIGFRAVWTQVLTQEVRRSVRLASARALLLTPPVRSLRRLGLASPEQQAYQEGVARMYETMADGHWGYGLLTAVRPA